MSYLHPKFTKKVLTRTCSFCSKTVPDTWGYGNSNKRYCRECVLKVDTLLGQLATEESVLVLKTKK